MRLGEATLERAPSASKVAQAPNSRPTPPWEATFFISFLSSFVPAVPDSRAIVIAESDSVTETDENKTILPGFVCH